MKKKPQQQRAAQTVEYISEAAIQLLDTPNTPAFTTNHIAERAGVSVGTLYRYFPDKSAIIRHVIKREIKHAQLKVLEMIRTSKASSAESLLCELAELLGRPFGDRAVVVHQIREMAKTDYEIVATVTEGRHEVVQELHKRVVALEPARFGDLSIQRLAAVIEAFVAAKRIFEASEPSKIVDAKTRVKLMKSFAGALS